MSPRTRPPIRVLQLVCAFLLLHHSNWQASMVSAAGHLQSSTRVLQHKSGLLGDEVTMCERTLNTDYTANLTECKANASKLFPGTVEDIDMCRRKYSEFTCQTEIACQHCDDSLQDWLANTQTKMNNQIKINCQDAAGQFHPFMCPITAAPTTKPTNTIPTTHNTTTRAPFPKWAIYTLASGVIIVIVLVILILWYGLTRFHHHASSHHHESDSKQSLKSTRTHKSSSSRGSGSQAKHNGKSIKYYPPIIIGGRPTPSYFLAARAKLKKIEEEAAAKKAAAGKKAISPAASTHKKASSGKVASRGKVTTSSARRTEAKQQQHHGPKMVNPRAHSTGNVKKGH